MCLSAVKLDHSGELFWDTPSWLSAWVSVFWAWCMDWTKGFRCYLHIVTNRSGFFFFKFNQATCPWMGFAWNFFRIFLIFLRGVCGENIICREYHHHHQSLNRGGSLGHHRWFCNQFSPFSPVLHCPLGLAELQACRIRNEHSMHLFNAVPTLHGETENSVSLILFSVCAVSDSSSWFVVAYGWPFGSNWNVTGLNKGRLNFLARLAISEVTKHPAE